MSCEFQKDIKFDDIQVGDLVLVELFDESGYYVGDRRGIAKEKFADRWTFETMYPIYRDAKGYRLFRVTVMNEEYDRKNLERVISVAESSESSEAILLVQEIRRLRKIEAGVKKIITDRKAVLDSVAKDIERERAVGYFYGSGGVHELTANADRIRAEVWPLEALLNE